MIKKIDSFIETLGEFKKQSVLLTFSIIVTFILVYILNALYPLILDDWSYAFAEGSNRVESLSDVFRSQYNHYFGWGGRSVVHVIAQTLLMLPPYVHDMANTLALLLLLYLFYRIANYHCSANVWVYVAICLMMWFLQPGFASVFFWITGSANYMWGMLIILLFLYPYYRYYRDEKGGRGNLLFAVFCLPWGIVAGWTNENMSFAIIAFVLFFYWLIRKEKKRIPIWSISGFVGVMIGTIIMLKAPGNAIRFASECAERGLDPSESMIDFTRIFKHTPYMLFLYFKRLSFIVIPYLILLYFYKKQNQKTENYKIVLNSSLLFFLAGNIAFFAMTASMLFPSRAYFGIISLLIISLAILLSNYKFNKVVKRSLFAIGCIVILTFAYDFYFVKVKTFRLIDITLENRSVEIEKGKKDGQTEFIFYDQIGKLSGRLFYTDCKDDPNFWVNRLFAHYHGIESVVVYPKENTKNN